MINGVVMFFLPHFLGIFPYSRVICIFPFFSVSLSLHSFSLSVSIPAKNYLLTSNRQAAFLFFNARKALLERHLNSTGYVFTGTDKDMMLKRFHSQNKKEGKTASETRDVIYFNIFLAFVIRDDVRKKEAKECGSASAKGPLNGCIATSS